MYADWSAVSLGSHAAETETRTYAGDTCGRRLGPASAPAEERFVGVERGAAGPGVDGGTDSEADIVGACCCCDKCRV
jgi:hypothetical protein